MPRVALCLSGQMRSYDRCFDALSRYILDPLGPDVFVFTWSERGGTYKTSEFALDIKNDRITYEELDDLYSPKAALIEDFQPGFTEELDSVKVPTQLKEAAPNDYKGCLPMFYTMYRCNELKKNAEREGDFTYDLVIRLRPDILFDGPVPADVLNHPETFWRPTAVHGRLPGRFITDQFAISGSPIMDYYASVFEMLPEYWRSPLGSREELLRLGFTDSELDRYPFELSYRVGERLMTYHILSGGIEIRDFDTRFRILRLDEPLERTFAKRATLYVKSWLKDVRRRLVVNL